MDLHHIRPELGELRKACRSRATPPEVEAGVCSAEGPPSGTVTSPLTQRVSQTGTHRLQTEPEEAEWLTEPITSTDDQGQHASLLAIASALR